MKKLTALEMNRLSVEEFQQAEKLPLTVVLDNVRSLHNVGAVFRTADAFRIKKICLCGITATPPSAEIHKTALGAENSVSWQYYPTAQEALTQLQKEGVFVYAVEQVERSEKLPELQLKSTQQYAIILGNEVKGVQQSVVDQANSTLEIPQLGTKHSLNVSVTAGIVMWEFAHQLLFANP